MSALDPERISRLLAALGERLALANERGLPDGFAERLEARR